MSREEMAIDLEGALREAQDEQADIRRLEERVARVMTEAALEEFPALKRMGVAQIFEFGDAVSRLSTDFAARAADIAYAAEQTTD